MGMKLSDIFKKDEETLIVDKRKEAIKFLIIFSAVIFVILIVLIVLSNTGDINETRRIAITKDIVNMQLYVKDKANLAKTDPNFVYPGKSLENNPQILNVNGIQEEYRYGYYWLDPADYADNVTALNVPNESYIVNYDSYDVVNINGIKWNKKRYHSIDDLVAIENGSMIPSENTYLIKNANEMQLLHKYPNAHFKLAGNIDMNGVLWNPVTTFSGTLDGRGYIISGLTINRSTQAYVGLFGEVTSNSKISNITFKDANVIGENYTGVLAGTLYGNVNNVIITNSNVNGKFHTGGIAGAHQEGTISKCRVDIGVLDGTSEVGGVVGTLNSGTVKEVKATVEKIYATSEVGGLVGKINPSTATYVQSCACETNLSATSNIGGLVGAIENLSSLLEIRDSYSLGNILTGNTNTGGLIGFMRAEPSATLNLENIYTTVKVLNKNETAGACLGYNKVSTQSASSVTRVFWEKNFAPNESMEAVAVTESGAIPLNFDAKSYDEMRFRTTFAQWDWVSTWSIKERVATPTLQFENSFKEYDVEVKKEK